MPRLRSVDVTSWIRLGVDLNCLGNKRLSPCFVYPDYSILGHGGNSSSQSRKPGIFSNDHANDAAIKMTTHVLAREINTQLQAASEAQGRDHLLLTN